MTMQNRSTHLTLVLIASLTLTACANVVRIAPHTDLKVIDPIWTTAYITRNHGYLVYDTLFALDENFDPQPQMVGKWSVSEDRLTWTFTLRDALAWHDGKPVTAADCVASLKRWSQRDGIGQEMFSDLEQISVLDEKTFSMKFRRPAEYILSALAKVSGSVPFMMPRNQADSDAFTPLQEAVGSGPFVFKRTAWEPGKKTVYLKNEAYVPRKEPASLAAGGKIAKADRIEWINFPDQTSAALALIDGEVDYVESPSVAMVPRLSLSKDVVVASTDPLGNIAMIRFNTLIPPFDQPLIRRAVLTMIDQEDYMASALGDRKYWRTCHSVFPCGTPMANEDLAAKPDPELARKMLQDAGYDGTPVVLLNPVDSPVIASLTRKTASKLEEIGMAVQLVDMSWAELTEKRASRNTVDHGGWNIFHTWWLAGDVMDPMAIVFSGNRDNGWYGWPDDPVLEGIRREFLHATSVAEQKRIAGKIQYRINETAVIGILGQFFEPVAYSTKVQGLTSPIQFYWNIYIGKK